MLSYLPLSTIHWTIVFIWSCPNLAHFLPSKTKIDIFSNSSSNWSRKWCRNSKEYLPTTLEIQLPDSKVLSEVQSARCISSNRIAWSCSRVMSRSLWRGGRGRFWSSGWKHLWHILVMFAIDLVSTDLWQFWSRTYRAWRVSISRSSTLEPKLMRFWFSLDEYLTSILTLSAADPALCRVLAGWLIAVQCDICSISKSWRQAG